jgi:hypothetical protein
VLVDGLTFLLLGFRSQSRLAAENLSVLKTPYLLPALMFHPSADTRLADDVRPRFASADCTKLRALTRRFAP